MFNSSNVTVPTSTVQSPLDNANASDSANTTNGSEAKNITWKLRGKFAKKYINWANELE